MPAVKFLRLGQPSVEVYMEPESSFAEAAAQVGIEASGTLLINGSTPAEWSDLFAYDTTVTVSSQVKGA